MTYRQSSTYADELTLYQTTIDRNPQCWLAYTNLGLAVMADNHQKGMRLIRESLEINPTNATALNALGYDLLREGRNFEAIGYLQNSVNQNSNIYVSQTNLAVALRRLGRVSEAIPHFQQAARLRPDLAVAHTNFGNALTDSGKTSQAIVEFQRALEIDPTNQYAQDKLAQLKMDKP
jgi:tetratricopeptide (TPR) repeat protein